MDEESQLKRLCDLLFECNLDSNVIYNNLSAFTVDENTFHVTKYRESSFLLTCDDETLLHKRIQLMNELKVQKNVLVQHSDTVTSLILQDTLAMWQVDAHYLHTLMDRFIRYYGLKHPRVALKYYQCAMLTSDLYVKHKLLTQCKLIATTCCLVSLIKLIDVSLKSTQDELRAHIRVKNVKLKCSNYCNKVNTSTSIPLERPFLYTRFTGSVNNSPMNIMYSQSKHSRYF